MAKRYANESKSLMTASGRKRATLSKYAPTFVASIPGAARTLRASVPSRSIAVVDVADREALDLDDVAERLREERVRAPAHDDLHLVAARDEVLADDLAARRVPHALADDAVEDAHEPLSSA